MARIGVAFLLLVACSTNPGNIASPSDPIQYPVLRRARHPPGPVCRVDALAFRNVRQYDEAENLLDGNMAGARSTSNPATRYPVAWTRKACRPLLIANGTPCPYVVRMEADRPLVEREMLTADTWAHTTCPVENFAYQTHSTRRPTRTPGMSASTSCGGSRRSSPASRTRSSARTQQAGCASICSSSEPEVSPRRRSWTFTRGHAEPNHRAARGERRHLLVRGALIQNSRPTATSGRGFEIDMLHKP